ncbi:M15 family metallopeptidase [Fodinicola acaciae]|uniref:M15 family metallopeptidase n=1 Tax=Fodinicola acaciae TaxID=2681555 RepID=UPI0013D07B0A|nr:M15 family metallopeptidase [Fodinicola acaciae]
MRTRATRSGGPRRIELPAARQPSGLARLQRTAGNRAVGQLMRLAAVQRRLGWTDASATAGAGTTDGKAWNAGPQAVKGTGVRRIPLEGLALGNKAAGTEVENRKTDEQGTAGKAIALVPAAVKPTTVDVLLHFHGNTGDLAARPYASWRQSKKDATVRDVALDRVAQQLDAAADPQLIGILPVGVGESSFNATYNADAYVNDILTRLQTEGELKKGTALGKIVLSGHSGGGTSVKNLLSKAMAAKGHHHVAEVVLLEAIGPRSLTWWTTWVKTQLDRLRPILTGSAADADKQAALDGVPKIRAYYSKNGLYATRYGVLRDAIKGWFDKAPSLGPWDAKARDLFLVIELDGTNHESIVGGQKASAKPKDGLANPADVLFNPITDALKARSGGNPSTAPAKPVGGSAAVGPAVSHPDMAAEWGKLDAKVQKAFGRGFKQYVAVRGLYEKRLHASPVDWLNTLQFGVPFCGFTLQGMDPRLSATLTAIQDVCQPLIDAVLAANVPVVFEGKFQPRAVTGKPGRLSDHALGLALHLNYARNPYIGRNNKVADLIERVAAEAGKPSFWKTTSGVGRKSTEADIERAYRTYAHASDALGRYFSELAEMEAANAAGRLDAAGQAEMKKRQAERAAVNKAHALSEGSHRDPTKGFFAHTAGVAGDPMLALIKALTLQAGLEWGGTYGSRPKDLHHFALKL